MKLLPKQSNLQLFWMVHWVYTPQFSLVYGGSLWNGSEMNKQLIKSIGSIQPHTYFQQKAWIRSHWDSSCLPALLGGPSVRPRKASWLLWEPTHYWWIHSTTWVTPPAVAQQDTTSQCLYTPFNFTFFSLMGNETEMLLPLLPHGEPTGTYLWCWASHVFVTALTCMNCHCYFQGSWCSWNQPWWRFREKLFFTKAMER